MYCTQCGSLIDGQDRFCMRCGYNLMISLPQPVCVSEPEKEVIVEAVIKKQEVKKVSFFKNYGKILLMAPVTEIVIRLSMSLYLAFLLIPHLGAQRVIEQMLPGYMMVPLRWIIIWSIPLVVVMCRRIPLNRVWSMMIGIVWMIIMGGLLSVVYSSFGIRSRPMDNALTFWLVPIFVYNLFRTHAKNCVDTMPSVSKEPAKAG